MAPSPARMGRGCHEEHSHNRESANSPMPRNEELTELMVRYQQGDSAGVTALVEALSPQLHRFFNVQFVTPRYADELLQEMWLRIHEFGLTYRPSDSVLPWIYAIARHTLVDHYRKVRR